MQFAALNALDIPNRPATPVQPLALRAQACEPPQRRRYHHMLLATDFCATTDHYHRRIVALAGRLAARISLLQLEPETDGGTAAASSSILLDGLTQRLSLTPAQCWLSDIRGLASLIDRAITDHGVDAIITGTPASRPELSHCRHIASLAAPLGCRVILINDDPDRD